MINCRPSSQRVRRVGQPPALLRPEAAFTMVEIALCLAVIAFALVAIIGVLPTGLRVQKDNREDTILNQEGTFLLEAIRSQSLGLDYLTNYVDAITVSNSQGTVIRYTNHVGGTGREIIELLSFPKYVPNPDGTILTNYVTASIRAISGSAVDKSPNQATRDFAFAYQLKCEVIPLNPFPRQRTNFLESGLTSDEKLTRSNLWRVARNQFYNFNELRLTLQGPVVRKGGVLQVLGTPKTYRALLSGARGTSPLDKALFQPNVFQQVQ